jgi:hypothetical protein
MPRKRQRNEAPPSISTSHRENDKAGKRKERVILKFSSSSSAASGSRDPLKAGPSLRRNTPREPGSNTNLFYAKGFIRIKQTRVFMKIPGRKLQLGFVE